MIVKISFVNAFTIVPIAPHALTNRPIVVADDSEIRITVARARDALASIDGHHNIELSEGDSVVIKRASATMRLWHPLDYDYYHTLRGKLGEIGRVVSKDRALATDARPRARSGIRRISAVVGAARSRRSGPRKSRRTRRSVDA